MADILKICAVFFLTLLLLRKRLYIGYVMLIASAVLALMYRMGPALILETAERAATNSITIKLLLALSLIRVLEVILREQHVLSAMMSAVKNFFRSRRVVIISMPMLIGMLPSLGGAYFSAPMVKEATTGLKMSREEKAFINYWFRHPWEFVLPLYPGILLAAAVSNVPLYRLISHNAAYALTLLATGFIFSMRGMGAETAERGDPGGAEEDKKSGWLSFLPVAAVLLLVVGVRIELHYALLAVIVPLILLYRYRPSEVIRLTLHGFAFEVIVLIFGIMFFKEVMETSGAVRNLSAFFVAKGIPSLPILCLLPLITGLLTGHTVGFVGSTFPLLISITRGTPIVDMSLAFAAGYVGVLLSPVHLCFVLTREYFKADLWGVYKKIIPAGLIIFCAALIEYLVLRH
jgi:integral membrane protein (TIGR00529 family)